MQCKIKRMHLREFKHAMMRKGKTMQEYKISYMQMLEWITTMYLMARLSILWVWSSSPDGDIGGDAFFCHRQSYFDFFLPKFQKIITLDILLHILLVIHLNLLTNLKILHEFDEGIRLLQLFHGFLSVETFDL